MKNNSDFYITTENGKDIHVTLLGFVDFEKRVYAVTMPYDDIFEYEEGYSEARIAIFLVSYVNKKPNFYLVNDNELASDIFNKFVDSKIDS